MPALNWEKFKSLPGDVRINFENLCRGIVRGHFGGFGYFKALKNQPGVEFHIKLDKDCVSLGSKEKWFGWQCKWYEVNTDKSLKAASKADIEDSLKKTKKYIPGLTDWVLWTPYTLIKKDQTWFEGLEKTSGLTLHMWAEEEIDNLLSGPTEMLRRTYFDELVLSIDDLKVQHDAAIEPIKDRWLPPVHQKTETEVLIRRILLSQHSFPELESAAVSLANCKKALKKCEPILKDVKELYSEFLDSVDTFIEILENLDKYLAQGDVESLYDWLNSPNLRVSLNLNLFVRKLRKLNLSVALDTTNAVDDMHLVKKLFQQLVKKLDTPILAILADAGGGKTQLAAELTKENDKGAYGVFFQGKYLTKNGSLDDLAKKYKISGVGINSFEDLIYAVNAAGQRAQCRLPIVIDGLNEAEDPRVWKDELATLVPRLSKVKNVVVVCTLRTGELSRPKLGVQRIASNRESFAVKALPNDIEKIEMDGFGGLYRYSY